VNALLLAGVGSGALSLLMVAVTCGLVWRRSRRPGVALWGLGWAVYAVHVLTGARDQLGSGSPLWLFVSLSSLGLGALLLYWGTASTAGRPPRGRELVWSALPVLLALGPFLELPLDDRLVGLPVALFVCVVDGLTALTLLRQGRVAAHRRAGWALAAGYAVWSGLKLVGMAVLPQGPALLALGAATGQVGLLLALALVVSSLISAEREARRRAERLATLSKLCIASDPAHSPGETLQPVLDELGRLLGADGSPKAFLREPGNRLWTVGGREPPPACLESVSEETCSCGLALRAGQMVSPDGPLFPPTSQRPDCPGSLAVPITARDTVLGAICAPLPRAQRLSPEEKDALETAGRQLGITLENARLVEATTAEGRRLRALTTASRRMAIELDLKRVLEGIAGAGMEAVQADRCAVYRYDAESDQLRVCYSWGLSQAYLDRILEVYRHIPAYRIAEETKAVWVEDVRHDPSSQAQWEAAREEGVRSVLAVPLVRHGEPFGALAFYHDRAHPYSPEDLQLCQALADQVAVALENASLYRTEQEARQLAERLRETSLLLNSSLNLEEVLSTILDQLGQVVAYDSGAVHILEEDATRVIATRHLPPSEIGRRYPLEQYAYNRRLAQGGGPIVIQDMHQNSEGWTVVDGLEHVRANIGVSLWVRDRVIGALTLDSRQPGAYTEADARIAQTFAHQAATAIENARLYSAQQRQAEEAVILLEAANAINSTLEPRLILKEIAVRAARACGAHRCTILLLDERDKTIIPIMSQFASRRTDYQLWRHFIDASYPQRIGDVPEAIEVIDTRQPLFIADAQSSSLPQEWIAPFDVGSVLVVPIISRERVVGLMGFDRLEVGQPFTPDQVNLAMTLGAQSAIAIENARLYQQEQQRRREAETLCRAAQALTTTLDRQEVFDRILIELQLVVPYDSASIQLLAAGVFNIIGGRGFVNLEELLGLAFDPNESDNPNGQVLQARAPLILEDAPAVYPNFLEEPHKATNIRAWMGVPLLFGDRVIGLLTLDKSKPKFYTPEHARLALAFAGQAAIAIENARLYEQLEQQSENLREAVLRLEEVDEVRNQVVQNVSHELRTPLTLIQGYTELLLNGDLGAVSPSQRNALEMIHDRAVILARLIYNLTALQKLPRETLTMVPLALEDMVLRAIDSYRNLAERAGIEFEIDLPATLPPVSGDREHLALVFMHLIDNAIKFSPNGGAVRVHAWAGDEHACVAVQDSGIGIAPKHMGHIFDRFYQADGSTTRRFSGMGVGLALVWEIVDAHGGTVRIKSEPGEGSTFTVTLPVRKENSQ
jgi:GAF domain-containing protein